jgi:hypothetical protein
MLNIGRDFIVILVIVLLEGCSLKVTKPINDPFTNTNEQKKEVQIQGNVIKGGLGYSFDLLYKDLNLSEYQVPIDVRKFGEVKKVDRKEFFPIVILNFTPISGKLNSILGLKSYPPGKNADTRLTCGDDLFTLLTELNRKYPTLEKYSTGVDRYLKDHIGYGFAPVVGPQKNGLPTHKGNYVQVECFKGENNWILSIDYINEASSKLAYPERKIFIKEKHQKILEQKGIDPNKL